MGSQSVRHNLATVHQQQICGFPVGSVVRNTPTNAGDTGLIPGSERSPGEGMATHLGLLAQEFAWTEEPGRLQSAEQNTTQHTDRSSRKFL